jgi:hypothetical protein
MTSDAENEDAAIVGRDAIAADRGMITVQWSLNQMPDRERPPLFVAAPPDAKRIRLPLGGVSRL